MPWCRSSTAWLRRKVADLRALWPQPGSPPMPSGDWCRFNGTGTSLIEGRPVAEGLNSYSASCRFEDPQNQLTPDTLT